MLPEAEPAAVIDPAFAEDNEPEPAADSRLPSEMGFSAGFRSGDATFPREDSTPDSCCIPDRSASASSFVSGPSPGSSPRFQIILHSLFAR